MFVSLDSEFPYVDDGSHRIQPVTCFSWALEDGRRGLGRPFDPGVKSLIAEVLEHHVVGGVSIGTEMAGICLEYPELIPMVWQAYAEDRVRDLKCEGKLLDIADDSLNFVAGAADPKAPYGLATLAHRYAGITLRPDKNDIRRAYTAELRATPISEWSEALRTYPVEDADAGLALMQRMPDSGEDKFRQAHGAWCALLMTNWGVRTDLARVARLKARLSKAWTGHKDVLLGAGFIRTDKAKGFVRNEKIMREYVGQFPGAQRTPPSKTHPTGQWSLNGVVLEEMSLLTGNASLLAYAKYASLNKRLTTEMPVLEMGEIHAFYNSLVNTGRMACGAEDSDDDSSTNLTNLPRKGGIRECYVPRPGKVYFDADVDGLEAVTGAQACLQLVGASTLADILLARPREDYHLHTTATFLDVPYADAVKRYKGHKLWKNGNGGAEDGWVDVMRQFAKIKNYGMQGGMGIPTSWMHTQKELKKDGKWDLAKIATKDFVADKWAKWRARYPEWPAYFDFNASVLGRDGQAQIPQLFSNRVRGISGGNAYTTLNNTWFQGLGADATKDWLFHVMRECYDPSRASVLLGSRVCIYAHDSITGECDPEAGHDCATRVGQILSEVSPRWCPDIPLTTTPCVTMAFSKDAEAVYDDNKRLVPWHPPEEKAA